MDWREAFCFLSVHKIRDDRKLPIVKYRNLQGLECRILIYLMGISKNRKAHVKLVDLAKKFEIRREQVTRILKTLTREKIIKKLQEERIKKYTYVTVEINDYFGFGSNNEIN
jgi:DNA-binding MarR family transcriptional regulator